MQTQISACEVEVEFEFVRQGGTKAIRIHFGQDLLFWSCARGSDLTEFDELLEYCMPNIDLAQVSYTTAREWEQELYRLLCACNQKRSALKAFKIFCEHIAQNDAKPYGAAAITLVVPASHYL